MYQQHLHQAARGVEEVVAALLPLPHRGPGPAPHSQERGGEG